MDIAISRRWALIGVVAAFAGHAMGQEIYPVRPIKLVVHTTAGSASDASARSVGEEMAKRLGQPVMVDNRAGAGGAIGADFVAKSPADGYTLLAGASSVMVMIPAVSTRKLPFDADADFTPIGRIGVSSFLLVVNVKAQINSFQELVAKAKAQPGKVTYASAGAGTNPHMLGEMMSVATGTSMTHVAYKGPGPAQVDLLAGVVDMQFDTASATAELIKSGKLKALAVTGAARLPAFPDVPTVVELGYPQMQLQGWTAMYAPRATPAPVVKKLREVFLESLKAPQVQATLLGMGQTPDMVMGDDLLKEQRASRDKWRALAVSRNIQLD